MTTEEAATVDSWFTWYQDQVRAFAGSLDRPYAVQAAFEQAVCAWPAHMVLAFKAKCKAGNLPVYTT